MSAIVEKLYHQPLTDVDDAAGEVETEMRSVVARMPRDRHASDDYFTTEPPVRTPPLPTYVEHAPDVPRVGALSAEAVVRDYEAAAKRIESMGKDLLDMASKCEAMTKGALSAIEYINDTATRYRDEAKRVFDQIELSTITTQEVRKLCDDMREKIGATGPAA